MSNLSPDFHSASEARLQADYDADASLTERLEQCTNDLMETLPKIMNSAVSGVRDDLPYAEVNAQGQGVSIRYMTLDEALTDLMADDQVLAFVKLGLRYPATGSASYNVALKNIISTRYAEIHATSLAEAKVLG